jgi:hypothetical protein
MNASVLLGLFFTIIVLIGAVAIQISPVEADIGCFILGTEVNGDNSVEYLGIGNC